jgi:glycosyltransferase involved in cell wall biosynthesis
MPKVLIITYYWPPSGGSSVLRWLKFTKYLREFGWEPVIYTPENPESQEIDEALLKEIPENVEVLKTKIWEPYTIYKKITGRKKTDRLGVALMSDSKGSRFINQLSLWIRSNLFIPDPKKFWVRPSVRALSKYLAQFPVDAIVTTGPPHSMHLIGLGLKKKTGIKWVADFRDPWTNIDFYKDLLLTKYSDSCHKRLEKEVLTNADCVVTVGDSWAEELRLLGAKNAITITNGFDYEPMVKNSWPDEGKFTLLHLGSIPKSRNPLILWKVISELVMANPGFSQALQIKLIGKTDPSVIKDIEALGLSVFLNTIDFVPHEQTFFHLSSATVLMLFINNSPNSKGILTNKFYEYLSACRPILAIGPSDGDAASIIRSCDAGLIIDFNDKESLKEQLLRFFELFTQGNLQINPRNIERFSRKNLTKQFSEMLYSLY